MKNYKILDRLTWVYFGIIVIPYLFMVKYNEFEGLHKLFLFLLGTFLILNSITEYLTGKTSVPYSTIKRENNPILFFPVVGTKLIFGLFMVTLLIHRYLSNNW